MARYVLSHPRQIKETKYTNIFFQLEYWLSLLKVITIIASQHTPHT